MTYAPVHERLGANEVFMTLLLMLLACNNSSIDLGDTPTGDGPKETSTAEDPTGDPTGDPTDDTTEDPTQPDDAGAYSGALASTLTMEGGPGGNMTMSCNGEANVEIAEDGAVSGDAWCTVDGAPPTEGELDGDDDQGDVSMRWAIRVGAEDVRVPLSGSVSGDELVVEGEIEVDRLGLLWVEIVAGRR